MKKQIITVMILGLSSILASATTESPMPSLTGFDGGTIVAPLTPNSKTHKGNVIQSSGEQILALNTQLNTTDVQIKEINEHLSSLVRLLNFYLVLNAGNIGYRD